MSDLHGDLAEWFRKMGYHGPILPEDLSDICNPKTKHIWEQLMQNIGPKEKVEYIKKNVLLNRLRAKGAVSKEGVLDEPPLTELEFVKKKQELEERIKYLKGSVLEKSVEFKELSETRKSREAALDAQKSRINSFERRNLVLKKKQHELKVQLLDSKKMLAQQTSNAGSTNTHSNGTDVKDVLKECANKLAETISDTHQEIKKEAIQRIMTENKSLMSASCSRTGQDTTTLKVSEEFKETISNHATNIEKALDGFQPEMVKQELQKNIKKSVFEFKQLTSVEGKEQPPKLTEIDVANLRFAHMKKELDILRQDKIIKELNTKINEKKSFILKRFEQLPNSDYMKECLEKKLQEISLNAMSFAEEKIINSVIVGSNTESDSDSLSTEIMKVKQDIIGQKLLIRWTVEELDGCWKEIRINQESARNQLFNIRSLITYADWVNLLREGLCYKEMKTFAMFSLDYQSNSGESSFFVQTDELSEHDRKLMLEIFRNSTDPPEKVLFNVWKIKFLLEHFQLLRKQQLNNPLFKDVSEKYSLQTLNAQENRAGAFAERFRLLLEKCTNFKSLTLVEKVKRSMEIWLQLPDVIVISSKRTMDGHDFEFYKRQLNRYV